MHQLRPYQLDVIARVRAAYAAGARAPIVAIATGSGKTVIAAEIMRAAVERKTRTLFVCHRNELVTQTVTKLSIAGVHDVRIIRAGQDFGNNLAPVTVASVQTITDPRWSDRIPDPGLIICDECFPAGSIVDGKPIETLQVGDLVRSFNHETETIELRPVRRLYLAKPTAMVTVHLDDGRRITCTSGHPFFTGNDYEPAAGLLKGASIYGVAAVQGMSDDDRDPEYQVRPRVHAEESGVLLNRLQKKILLTPRRERQRPNRNRVDACTGVAGRMDHERDCYDQHETRIGVPDAFQDRRRFQGAKDRNRDRWSEPSDRAAPGSGSPQTRLARVARVDRVEVHEPRDPDRFESVCPDGLVYNIEVEGNHNYFVDDVLVHNCHHFAATTFRRVPERYPRARLLGLSATPCRGDNRPLDLFDALVTGPSVAELTAMGHLVPCTVYGPAQQLEPKQIAISPAEAYQRYGAGQRAVVFCATIDHAEQVAAEMNGIVVHGKLSIDERTRRLAGKPQIVVNVWCLTEGFDDPSLAVCIMTRAPKHVALYLQMIGRILRPSPGKTRAILCDLAGAVHAHGTPDADRTFSLDGKVIRTERQALKQCPVCGAVRVTALCSCGFVPDASAFEAPRILGVAVGELPRLPPRTMRHREIDARFASRCPRCESGIRVGARVLWRTGEKAIHVGCAA